MMLPVEPRALFLDLDGTIADSLGMMRAVYQGFLADFGVEGTDEEFASLNGPPLDEVIRRLKVNHGLQPPLENLRHAYHRTVDTIYEQVPAMPGTEALMQTAQARDCCVAVVTSNSRQRSLRWLERLDLMRFVSFVVAAEDVTKGKPDPMPYRFATEQAACPVQQIVVVEDSRQGSSAALGAGLATALIGDFTGESDLPQGAVVVPSLASLKMRLWP